VGKVIHQSNELIDCALFVWETGSQP